MVDKKPNKVNINIRIDEPDKLFLMEQAFKEDRSLQYIVVRILKDYIDAQKEKSA